MGVPESLYSPLFKISTLNLRNSNNFDIWVKKIRELLDSEINECQIDLEVIP